MRQTKVEPHVDPVSEIVPGLLRIRVPLPFPPKEVNAWLLAQEDGWTLVDCGVDDAPTRALFEAVLDHPLVGSRPVRRLLFTHFHPDHLGLCGWLHARTGAPVHMTRTEWLQARVLLAETADEVIPHMMEHGRWCDAPRAYLSLLESRGLIFKRWVRPLPNAYTRLIEDDEMDLAGTRWRVIVGEGHSPEMACLYSPQLNILISADQILGRITPFIGVWPSEPEADPLGLFLASLAKFEHMPADTLVLPSHGEPFVGLPARIADLRAHHEERLVRLLDHCRTPRTVMDSAAILFKELPVEQLGFALGETLAHLRHLVARGQMNLTGGRAPGTFVCS